MPPSNRPSGAWSEYETLSTDAPTSIVWASTGGEGSGKSAFLLTAPEPIFICAFDAYGMNRVGKQFKTREDGTAKDIRIARYPFNPKQYKDGKQVGNAAQETWDRFVADYRLALQNCRSIGWDREDLAWELLRYASFGEQSAAPKEYGDLNIEYVSLIQEANAASVNLGLLRGIREKWVSKFDPGKGKMVAHNTGEMIPDGMKKIPDHVDVTLAHRWDSMQKAFVTKIEKFTNPDERDNEYPNLTWIDMALLAYPETTTEDWQ